MKLIYFLFFTLTSNSLFSNTEISPVLFKVKHHISSANKFDLKRLKVSSYNYVSNKFEYYETETKSISDSVDLVKVLVESPADVTIFGKRFYIEPGQKWDIEISLNAGIQAVDGDNRGNYFCWSLANNINSQSSQGHSILVNIEYNRRLYLKRKHILDSLNNLGIISRSCYNYAYDEYFYSYIGNLLTEYKNLASDENTVKKKIETICDDRLFQTPSNLNSKFYGFALTKYVMYILGKWTDGKYTGHELENLISLVDTKYSGSQKDFLFSYLYRLFCRKQEQEYENTIDFLFPVLLKKIKDQKYKEVVTNWHFYYHKYSKPLPDSLLETWVYSSPNDSVRLNSLFKNDKKNVIEFWATWCSPCIKQLKEYANNREKVENKLNVIAISIDDNVSNVFSVANKLQIQTYWLPNMANNLFLNYFSIPPIPKTILVEKVKVVDTDFDFYAFLRSLR